MKSIDIDVEESVYTYYMYESISEISNAIKKISMQYSNSLLIFDSNVPKCIVNKLMGKCDSSKYVLIRYETNESKKTLKAVSTVLDLLLDHKANRNSCVFIVGGGVLGNIAGLACGLLYRGIDFVHIPSTIMACSDSVISLKQGINKNYSKNVVGMYYSPSAVMICPELYSSLELRDVAAGYVEFVKNLMIVIPDEIENFLSSNFNVSNLTYETLEQLVLLSIKAKLKLISRDKYEKKDGVLLEYGHTIGHSLEMLFSGEIRHGEGVAVGMLVAARLSFLMNFLKKEEVGILKLLLEKINEFYYLRRIKRVHPNLDLSELRKLLKKDNKNGYIYCKADEVAMVVLDHLGVPLKTGENFVIPVKLESVLSNIEMVWEEI